MILFINNHQIKLLLISIVFLLEGCAYFNTFYNAEQYFEKAEKLRLSKAGETIPPAAIDAYSKVIEKSKRVMQKYPDSKYVQPALILIGKSHFYRTEFRISERIFQQYAEEYIEDNQQAEYWLSLCKWKLGKPQPALEQLNILLDETNDKELRSKIYLSQAEIYLEDKNEVLALEYLEYAASTNRDRDERGQIYYRIADLAFQSQEYERALTANKEVLKNTTSKKRREEANLQIVRIHRLLRNWDEMKRMIKTMLLDNIYKSIHGDLEIELVKLYQMDNQLDEAMTRLESIRENYPKTYISAEASYIYGEIALFDYWDLENAAKYYGKVTPEFRQSSFAAAANIRVKEISEYQVSLDSVAAKYERISTLSSILDTVGYDSIKTIMNEKINALNSSIAGYIFNLGELDAFHFSRQDSSQIHYKNIVDNYEDSEYYPKALFTLYYLSDINGDTLNSSVFKARILSELPNTEYADYLRKSLNSPKESQSEQAILRRGEKEWLANPAGSLKYYKQLINGNSQSETASKAAYFLAYHYDATFYEPDSALKYYTILNDNYGNSEQANAGRTRYNVITELLKPTMVDTTINEIEMTIADTLSSLIDSTFLNTNNDSTIIDSVFSEPDTLQGETRVP